MAQRLLPMPFTLLNTSTEEGQSKGEKFVHKFIMCADLTVSREMVLPFGIPSDGQLRHSEKVRCVALAPIDAAQCLPSFYPLLKRYLLLADHYHLTAEMHEAEDLSNIEMTEFVAEERPWNQNTQRDVDAVRDTYAHGKCAQMDSPNRKVSKGEQLQMETFFHDCMHSATCVNPEVIDSALHLVGQLERDASDAASAAANTKGK